MSQFNNFKNFQILPEYNKLKNFKQKLQYCYFISSKTAILNELLQLF